MLTQLRSWIEGPAAEDELVTGESYKIACADSLSQIRLKKI